MIDIPIKTMPRWEDMPALVEWARRKGLITMKPVTQEERAFVAHKLGMGVKKLAAGKEATSLPTTGNRFIKAPVTASPAIGDSAPPPKLVKCNGCGSMVGTSAGGVHAMEIRRYVYHTIKEGPQGRDNPLCAMSGERVPE